MMKEMLGNSYLFGGNAPFIEDLYETYLQNPDAVTPEWRRYFDQMQQVPGARDVAHAPIVESFVQRARAGAPGVGPAVARLDRKQVSVVQLVAEYRFRGVLLAQLDPLKRREPPHIAELEPAYYDLTEADMDTVFNTGSLIGPEQATLREIIQPLQQTYCGARGPPAAGGTRQYPARSSGAAPKAGRPPPLGVGFPAPPPGTPSSRRGRPVAGQHAPPAGAGGRGSSAAGQPGRLHLRGPAHHN